MQLESVADELNAKMPLDEKLRHVVPPAVRALQDELKTELQSIVQAEFTKVAEKDEQMTAFLKQFGLPQVLHSLQASNDMPDDVWTKIEDFQKKGAAQNFSKAIAGAENTKQLNMDIITACRSLIDAEENEDTQLRTQHGARFNRPPSSTVNQAYKQSLMDYQTKIEMAAGTDVQIKTKYDSNTEGFALLSKTRQDLSAMIPQSANAGQISQDPVVVGIKDALA